MAQALIQGAKNAGLGDHTFAGVMHAKDSLYTREFGAGPLRDKHQEVRYAWLHLPWPV